MPTPLEDELGLGPAMHKVRKWSRGLMARLSGETLPQERRALDPLTVNYAAWNEVRRTVREWPHYKEAANSLEILVSPEDWDEYWGIDATRKEQGVAAYVRARAAEKGLWMAGDPQVIVLSDEMVAVGEVQISCQFLEPVEGGGFSPLTETSDEEPQGEAARPSEPRDAAGQGRKPQQKAGARAGQRASVRPEARVGTENAPDADEALRTMRMIAAASTAKAALTDDNGFRLEISSGDCVGAVRQGDEVPEEVNVRLDAQAFPYVSTKQCEFMVLDDKWTVTNHSYHGTMVVTRDGRRLMLGEPVPYPIAEGDLLYLGPEHPLRFELA